VIATLIAAFVAIALIDMPRLVKNKRYRRELVVYCILLASSFTLALLYFRGVKIPSPIKGVQYLIMDVLHLGY